MGRFIWVIFFYRVNLIPKSLNYVEGTVNVIDDIDFKGMSFKKLNEVVKS